ncbi:MAG: hypothetical protein AAF560_23655 [Acidobacteriota bacterium]
MAAGREFLGEAAARLDSNKHQAEDSPWPAYYSARLYKRLRKPEAEPRLREAVRLLEQRGEVSFAAKAQIELADFLRRKRRQESAGIALEQAFQLAQASEDPQDLLATQYHQARLWLDQGQDLGRAYLLLHQVYKTIMPEWPDRQLQRNCLSALASVSYELGRYGEAQDYRDQQLKNAEQAGTSTANARYNLAVLEIARGKADETSKTRAIVALHQAKEAARAVDDRLIEGHTRHLLGRLIAGAEGGRQLERCLRIAGEIGDTDLQSECYAALAVNRLPESQEAAR